MLETFRKSWWLLAACGVFDALYSAMNFLAQRPDGSLALRTSVHGRTPVVEMGMLAFAAGLCTIAAAVWNANKNKPWLLLLSGLACSALGALLTFWTRRLSFGTIALLIAAMAISNGLYALASARTLRNHFADKWALSAAGVISVGFALAFFAFVIRWIKLNPGSPAQSLHWLGSYFAFSAVCMLTLALRLYGTHLSAPGPWTHVPSLGNPKHAQ